MKTLLTEEYIINGWLTKYHNTTLEKVFKEHPDWTSREFYPAYPVTTQQHDEWYEWAISELGKNLRMPKKMVRRSFSFEYLNTAPNIKDITLKDGTKIKPIT